VAQVNAARQAWTQFLKTVSTGDWSLCRASFIALYFLVQFGDHNELACAAVMLACAAVALSRSFMGRHYLGDVLGGAMLGILTTAIVTNVRRLVSDSVGMQTSVG
jgi:PAP2 superfamily